MFKSLILLLSLFPLTTLANLPDCDSSEKLVLEKFLPTPFGKKARNILDGEALEVSALLADFKTSHAQIKLSHLEILVCTSAYPIPPISITDKNENEHIELAMQRAFKIKKEFNKQSLPTQVSHKVCGPAYVALDKNWRVVVKGKSGNLYNQAYDEIAKTEGILEQYKNEALIESFDEVKTRYPEPFMAKYQPFQGYRVKIFGNEICSSNHHQVKTRKEESKGTKQKKVRPSSVIDALEQ